MTAPGPAPQPTRRAVLRGGTAAAVVAVAAGLTGVASVLGSCTRNPPQPDDLEGPLAAARADAALADAAAAAHGDLAARLGPVAADRRAHADALDREVRRARPDRSDALDDAATPGPPPPVPRSSDAALNAVGDALGRARDDGRRRALVAEPYRCGLLTSVAACCAGHVAGLARTGLT